jgi:hypothetical protein
MPPRQADRHGSARISAEVPMPTGTVEKELLELENRYWQAIQDRASKRQCA